MRQTKEGPRTVLGINPDGEDVWMSFQAPAGYISINENEYWDILKLELGKCKFTSHTAKGITEEMEAAAVRAMKKIAKIINSNAPVGISSTSPTLSKSFQVVPPGDAMLDKDDSERTLIIGMED